jgi:hypothetical protein
VCDQIVEVTDSIVSLYMHLYTLSLLVCAVLFIVFFAGIHALCSFRSGLY